MTETKGEYPINVEALYPNTFEMLPVNTSLIKAYAESLILKDLKL